MRDWEAFVPEEERKIYEKAGYKGQEKFGVNPALIIIDVITGFTGTKPMPVMEAIDEFPTSCGQVAWDALPKIRELLHACRDAKIPVIYSTSDPEFKAAFGNATKRGTDKTDFEKLAVEFPFRHFPSGPKQTVNLRIVQLVLASLGELPQIPIRRGTRQLYQPHRMNQRPRQCPAGDGEILDGPLGLSAVVGLGGDLDIPHGIVFGAERHGARG